MIKSVDIELLNKVALTVLEGVPRKAFFCLPMSAYMYAILKDGHGYEPKILTGNLSYDGATIFKQDFSISSVTDQKYRDWAGHAWVEIEEIICDISIFRTVYSDDFAHPCKLDFIQYFGTGRGGLLATKSAMQDDGLIYQPIDILDDNMATGIIKGAEYLLN